MGNKTILDFPPFLLWWLSKDDDVVLLFSLQFVIEGAVSQIRSQSTSPTPTKEKKTKRKNSFRISFRKSSLFSRAGNEEKEDEEEREGRDHINKISFLGQIYKNAKNRFSLTKSCSISSNSSATELTKQWLHEL